MRSFEHKIAAISYKTFKNYRRRASLQRQPSKLDNDRRVAHITYHGRGNGDDPEINAAKVENLRLMNAIARTKLAKLSGAVVDQGEVEFVVSSALSSYGSEFLRCLGGSAQGFSGLSNTELHAVKMQIQGVIDKALEKLADDLERARRSGGIHRRTSKRARTLLLSSGRRSRS